MEGKTECRGAQCAPASHLRHLPAQRLHPAALPVGEEVDEGPGPLPLPPGPVRPALRLEKGGQLPQHVHQQLHAQLLLRVGGAPLLLPQRVRSRQGVPGEVHLRHPGDGGPGGGVLPPPGADLRQGGEGLQAKALLRGVLRQVGGDAEELIFTARRE